MEELSPLKMPLVISATETLSVIVVITVETVVVVGTRIVATAVTPIARAKAGDFPAEITVRIVLNIFYVSTPLAHCSRTSNDYVMRDIAGSRIKQFMEVTFVLTLLQHERAHTPLSQFNPHNEIFRGMLLCDEVAVLFAKGCNVSSSRG